jgi:hypothetical protein
MPLIRVNATPLGVGGLSFILKKKNINTRNYLIINILNLKKIKVNKPPTPDGVLPKMA